MVKGSDKEKKAQCIKERANWGVLKAEHKFDHKSFSINLTKKNLPNASPKLNALIDKIKELDKNDMKTHGKLFKHFIYSDVKSAYGAKLIASGLSAAGFKHAYDLKKTNRGMSFVLNKFDGKSNTFATLTSVVFFEKPIGINFRKELLSAFNNRPDNIQGKNIRIFILDSGFREGIDLFDVKYVHLFEPIITKSDEKQAIGRATRFCGQKGLKFDSKYGWPLHVFRYETTIPSHIKNYLTSFDKEYNTNTFFELFLKFSNIDLKKITFATELETVTVDTAVDKYLTKEVHDFKIPTTGGSPVLTKAEKIQNKIATDYAEFKWQPVKIENTCVSGGAVALSFTPTQEFVRRYFTPRYPNPGMLLWHSVGTGKLCTAISTLTSTFEPEGYTILYVTRYTLKGEVWKNVFDQTCSLVIQDLLKQGKTLPEAQAAKLRLLSKGWFEPMSYRQLSNLIAGKNQLTEKLYELNGKTDPLRKTVIVIDEAHKLFAADVEGQEKADLDVLKNAFMHSNRVSGKDGVKLLFMTATPYTSEPMDLMRLLNLLRPVNEQLPEIFEDFSKEYLDENGSFTPEGKTKYHNQIAGYISYLNREKDIRSFAYPIVNDIHIPMSEYEYMEVLNNYVDMEVKYKSAVHTLKLNKSNIEIDASMYRKNLQKELQEILKPKYEEHATCLEQMKVNMNDFKKDIKLLYNNALKKCKEEANEYIKQIKEEYKEIIKQVRLKLKEDSKKKTAQEKEELKKKADRQIENLKLDQTFDCEQVYQNIDFIECNNKAEEMYKEQLENMPVPTSKEYCNSLLDIIKETEKQIQDKHNQLIEDFKKEQLKKLEVDERAVAALKIKYDKLLEEKNKAIAEDVSQLTGLEKCLAPKVKPLSQLILSGDSIPEEDTEEEQEEIDDNIKDNIYLITGHGSENVVKFNKRNVMPKDKVLVVFPVCSRPNYMDSACTFIKLMNDPANKKYIENPIKYNKEIMRLLKRPIRIYLPGEYVPEMSTNLFLDFQKGSKIVIAKSGVHRINTLKEMDRSILKQAKTADLQLGSQLCKPYIGVLDRPLDYTNKAHKEVFKGNVFAPASKIDTYQKLKYRNFTLKKILEETGSGIYYYVGCRVSFGHVPELDYIDVIKQSDDQQEKQSRQKKIEPVIPFIKVRDSQESPLSSIKTPTPSKEETPDKKEDAKIKKELYKLKSEINKVFETLENIPEQVSKFREKLLPMPNTPLIEHLLYQLEILEKLDNLKDSATQELKVKQIKDFYHFINVSVVKLNNTKYSFNARTYGYIPTNIRAVEEKCSSSNLRKIITNLYKKGKYIDLPQEPTTDKEVFLDICKKVKII